MKPADRFASSLPPTFLISLPPKPPPPFTSHQLFFLLSKVTRHQVRLERSTVRPAPVSSLQVPSQMSTSLPHYRVDHWSKIPAPRNPAAALRILQTGGIQRIRNQSENNLMAREREREREREKESEVGGGGEEMRKIGPTSYKI